MTDADVGDLLDVNVWLALAVEEHPHHDAARSYWTTHAMRPRFFCRVSAMSLVRLLSHPRLMADRPLSLGKAWGVFEAFAALPGVAMLHEPQGVDATLGALVKDKLPARLFTDAYFAALARVAALRLITFDKDFERFSGLANLRLTKQRNA
jgi:toxin-antitoxin system PIN domain toxin